MNQRTEINNEICALYELYGFKVEQRDDNYLLFSLSQGYFNNAEIVYHDENSIIHELQKEYENVGYAIVIKQYTSIEDIHEKLFEGFFKPQFQEKKLISWYKKFEETRKKIILNNVYSYIPCNYELNSKFCEDGLIEFLDKKIADNNSSLTFLEAAAGFGKTCTTYELMNQVVSKKLTSFIPLFIELSKNRSAKVFRYVLLDEFKDNFPGLKYDLILEEIKNGRIPLIIDGFDELLSESKSDDDKNTYKTDQTQTMINTILELFSEDSKTKIIITSRKTSFRMGNVFDSVLEKITHEIEVNQITIGEPNINKWLSVEKREKLKDLAIPIDYFKTPIMLSYLKAVNLGDLTQKKFTYERMVYDYIDKLLEREMERQSLNFSPKEQRNIFIYLASYFLSFHFTSEEPTFIFELLKEILNEHFDLKEKISMYTSDEERPSEIELITKISHHALLDTNAAQKNNIGFLNDFIFGLFMGLVILEDKLQEKNIELTESEIDKICTVYAPMSDKTKNRLYSKFLNDIVIRENEIKLHLDNVLQGKLSNDYSDLIIESEVFDNFDFSQFHINNSYFSNCIFKQCNISTIQNSQFCNCHFYPTNKTEVNKDNMNTFIKCDGIVINDIKVISKPSGDFIKLVLEQYWPKGKERAELKRWPKTLYRGFDKKECDAIDVAIEELEKKKLITWTGLCYQLNLSKIAEIKKILGR